MPDQKRIKWMEENIKKYIPADAKILEIGGGMNRITLPNVAQLDYKKFDWVDVVHDAEKTPLPFKNNTFDCVFSHAVFEHIYNFLKFVEDSHRILKPDGKLIFYVPHFAGLSSVHFLHRNYFSVDCLNFFSPDNPDFNYETDARFATRERRITFMPILKLIEKIVNISDTTRRVYEGTILKYIFPPQMIFVVLEAIK